MEYGAGITFDDPYFYREQFDLKWFRGYHFSWIKVQIGGWARCNRNMEALEAAMQLGAKEAASRVKPIASALERFAKQAGAEGHGALGFALVCFSAALDKVALGLPLDFRALEGRINSSIELAQRRREMERQYAAQARAQVAAHSLREAESEERQNSADTGTTIGVVEPLNGSKTPE
jgi:hypothetical protein